MSHLGHFQPIWPVLSTNAMGQNGSIFNSKCQNFHYLSITAYPCWFTPSAANLFGVLQTFCYMYADIVRIRTSYKHLDKIATWPLLMRTGALESKYCDFLYRHFTKRFSRTCDKCREWVGVAILGEGWCARSRWLTPLRRNRTEQNVQTTEDEG